MAWISETEAAKLLGRKPRTLREKAKKRAWPITFSAIEGRCYQYSKADIEKLLTNHSNKARN